MLYVDVDTEQVIGEQEKKFGIFFEDISHAADGGLYGELIRNRSFEFDPIDSPDYNGMTGWEIVSRGNSITVGHIEQKEPLNDKNRDYLRLEVTKEGSGGGVRNSGFNSGIAVKQDEMYRLSFWYRNRKEEAAKFQAVLENADGKEVYGSVAFILNAKEWTYYETVFQAAATVHSAKLALLTKGTAEIDFDMVSLFPLATFKDRKNGMRRDIAEMLEQMHPAFMRFPGGCLAHIGSLHAEDRNSMYRWKNTIGPLEERPSRRNSWNYNQSLGLGYFEYFQFCEDIHADPLPVIAAGYDPHFLRSIPMDQIEEWIDEALDLIEFANGDPITTEYGKMRAQMGHPTSFHLKYLGIGNEEIGEPYYERYEAIVKAVREKYPEIMVIASAGAMCSGDVFERGWELARKTDSAYVDEHFYQCPEWFVANADRYLSRNASGPKAFLGEYASGGDTWKNALYEAAFMINMEKAPGLGLACYAPLLCNTEYQNWSPNLIQFDNHRIYGTPSYYVQKLFMNHFGEQVLQMKVHGQAQKKHPALMTLGGGIRMSTTHADVMIKDLQIITEEEIKAVPDFSLSEEHITHELGSVAVASYKIKLRFCRMNTDLIDDLNGIYSFNLEFAGKDEKNRLGLEIGGWQRQVNLTGMIDGEKCVVNSNYYPIEDHRWYSLELCVEGAQVNAFIDGKRIGTHTYRLPEPEEIYYSARKDREGSIIIKLVNLHDLDKKIKIHMTDERLKKVAYTEIADCSLSDTNTFEAPQHVYPVTWEGRLESSDSEVTLKRYSLLIMKLTGEQEDVENE